MLPPMKTPSFEYRLALTIITMTWILLAGCSDEPAPPEPGPPIVPTQGEFEIKPPGEDRPILGPVQFVGVRVLAYRRSLASGLIEVHDERVTDASAARRTLQGLIDTGWSAWPPKAAPELAIGLTHLAKDSMECGYLLHVSKRPQHWRRTPSKIPRCFATLSDVEKALKREEQIRFHIERERWCNKKRATFPPVSVPVEDRCNVRVQLYVGELTKVGP